MGEKQGIERHFRPAEVAKLTGLAMPTIRKKILRRELAYRKVVRAILIPQSEVERLLGKLIPAIGANGEGRGR